MRFLRRIKGKTKRDRIRNAEFRQHLKIKPIDEIIVEAQMRWLGHLYHMGENSLMRRVYVSKC